MLGSKHSGKRSLIDSLFDISKTTIHSKRLTTNHLSGKMKLKGLAPVLDYAYLNVLDLNDPDYRTHPLIQELTLNSKFIWSKTPTTTKSSSNLKNPNS